MASRQADSLKLVSRISKLEPVGWRTEKSSDGYKIFDPRGGNYTIHMTYSDVKSLTNLIQSLERGGLKTDERKLRQMQATQRARKLANEREVNERRTQELVAASQKQAVTRAAGPYMTEIEPCDLSWLTAPHPAPWMRWMYITPKAAQILLEDYNDDNRKLSEDTARQYALIILAKQWHLTHQGMAIDTRPKVQDAQHRLRGIVIAGEVEPDIEVPFAVFVGMPPENFKAIDEGRLRNAAQMLAKAGESVSGHLNTVLKMVAAYDSASPREFVRQRMRTAQTFEVLDTDPEGFRAAALWGSRNYKRVQCTPGPLGALYYLLRRANGKDNPHVNAFLEGLAYNRKHGTDLILPDDDPRRVLLSKYANTRPAPIEAVFWGIHAWNNMVLGRHPRYMRVSDDTDPPEILLSRPGQGATPRGLAGEV